MLSEKKHNLFVKGSYISKVIISVTNTVDTIIMMIIVNSIRHMQENNTKK